MFGFQAGVSFLIWIAYGFFLRTRAEKLRTKLFRIGRSNRVLIGAAGMVGALVVLVGGLLLVIALGGLSDGALTPWAWLMVTITGVAFVHLQAVGVASMVSLILQKETSGKPEPSNSQETLES